MKDETIVVKIEFYDHGLGREQVAYGEVKATKIDRFETNEDSWITLTDSFMSRRNTIVVPAGKMGFAMEIILAPIIERMLKDRTA